MEFELTKLVAPVLSALATIAAYNLNKLQVQKSRAELLEKLTDAIERNQNYLATELFQMLHGLRLDYSDVRAICSDDASTQIIYALKKTPGMVRFEDGKFLYTELFQSRWFKTANRIASKIVTSSLWFLTLVVIFSAAISDGPVSIAMSIILVPILAVLALEARSKRYDRMVEKLTNRGET